MIDTSAEAKPAEGAPVDAPLAPASAPMPEVVPSSPAPEAHPAPTVGDPLPSAPEGNATTGAPEPSSSADADAAGAGKVDAGGPDVDMPPPAGEGDSREAVEEGPASAATDDRAPSAPVANAPLPRLPRAVPPILEFAAWRLLELVVTAVVATILIGLLLPSGPPADLAVLADRLGVTIPLVLLSLLIAALFGVPVGYISARAGGWVDVGLRALTTLGLAFNPIWLAMVLVLLLAHNLQWLRPGGFVPWSDPVGALSSLLLPALALGLPLAAATASRLRDSLVELLSGPALRTADERGQSRAEMIHDFALRLSAARALARLAVPLAMLVPMSLMVEAVFYLPGLGRLIFAALVERDFASLQLGLVTLVTLVAMCRFLALLLEARLDPRIARRV